MQVGNARYRDESDLAAVIPVFPLSGALLLPGGRMPLNIFELGAIFLIRTVVTFPIIVVIAHLFVF